MNRVSDLSDWANVTPISSVIIMISLALIPFLFLGVTSFLKVSVVLNILRNAIGASQIPSAAITSLLSIVLTLYIMAPVASRMLDTFEKKADSSSKHVSAMLSKKKQHPQTFFAIKDLVAECASPLVEFMIDNANMPERIFFAQRLKNAGIKDQNSSGKEKPMCLDRTTKSCLLEGETFFSLLPAFMLSELKAAFVIGFMIFLPFLVIDLVVSNILLAMGMTMLTPATVALPFKILLFVISDTWFLLCRSLILSY